MSWIVFIVSVVGLGAFNASQGILWWQGFVISFVTGIAITALNEAMS
jgi:hypothetical protein